METTCDGECMYMRFTSGASEEDPVQSILTDNGKLNMSRVGAIQVVQRQTSEISLAGIYIQYYRI